MFVVREEAVASLPSTKELRADACHAHPSEYLNSSSRLS